MNAYEIKTPYNRSQKHIVVAGSMASAEKVFLDAYPNTKINSILLDAAYVLVESEDK